MLPDELQFVGLTISIMLSLASLRDTDSVSVGKEHDASMINSIKKHAFRGW